MTNNSQPTNNSKNIPNVTPNASSETPQADVQKIETKTQKRPAKKILVVDDNPLALKEAEAILKKDHYEVLILGNPKFVLKTIEAERPDVIVLDIIMSPIDGYTLCAEIKKLYLDKIPVLLCTAQSYEQDLVQKMHKEFGADDYILKPLNAEDFLKKIKALSKRRKKLMSESLPENEIRQR